MMLRSLTEPGLQEVITILLAWLNSLLFAEDRYPRPQIDKNFGVFLLSEVSLHGCPA
jgi:hypothetical protein